MRNIRTESSVNIVTRPRTENLVIMFRFSVKAREIFLHIKQSRPAYHYMGTWTSFPEGEEADRILHTVSRLRISGALPPLLCIHLGG